MTRLRWGPPTALLLILRSVAHAGPPPAVQHPSVVIPGLPGTAATFGLVVVGRVSDSVLSARDKVQASLETRGHRVVLLPALDASPQRAAVLKMCVEGTLDGVATVRISTGVSRPRAHVEVRDMNGDLFTESTSESRVGMGTSSRESRTSFSIDAVPATSPSEVRGESKEPRAATASPTAPPPLLWFDERGATTVLGDMRMADGEVYRVLQRPDLSARYERRRAWKRALKISGIPLLIAGFIVSSAALAAAELQTVASRDSNLTGKETSALVIGGTLLYGGVAALIVGGVMDADPVGYDERLSLARAYNRERLQSQGNGD